MADASVYPKPGEVVTETQLPWQKSESKRESKTLPPEAIEAQRKWLQSELDRLETLKPVQKPKGPQTEEEKAQSIELGQTGVDQWLSSPVPTKPPAELAGKDPEGEAPKPQEQKSEAEQALGMFPGGQTAAAVLGRAPAAAGSPERDAELAKLAESAAPDEFATQGMNPPEQATSPAEGQESQQPQKRYTPEETFATPEMQGPQDAAAQRDENAAAEAEYRVKVGEETRRQQLEADQRFADSLAASTARYERAAAEAQRSSHISGLMDNWSDGKKLQARIAIALSGWGGGPNRALELLKMQMDQDFQAKRASFDNAVHRMASEGANQERLKQFHQMGLERILAGEKAKLTLFGNKLAKTLAAFPQAQQDARQVVAKAEADMRQAHAKELAATLAGNTSSASTIEGQRVKITEGKDTGKNGPTESENKLAMLGSSMKEELDIIKTLPSLSQDALSAIQNATLAAEAADATASKDVVGSAVVKLARWADLIPKSRYASLSADDQKTINAWDNAIEKYARVLTGAGMPADEARRMARQNGPIADDRPELVTQKYDRLVREADRMVALAGAKALSRLPAAVAKESSGLTPLQKNIAARLPEAQSKLYIKAIEVAATPNHPHRDKAIAVIKQAMTDIVGGKKK